ncbi:MAG: hypothetical protein KC416_12320 [Myxococcales bacterium]|nr:hypothetical protein [Myxococcales bacterium]
MLDSSSPSEKIGPGRAALLFGLLTIAGVVGLVGGVVSIFFVSVGGPAIVHAAVGAIAYACYRIGHRKPMWFWLAVAAGIIPPIIYLAA